MHFPCLDDEGKELDLEQGGGNELGGGGRRKCTPLACTFPLVTPAHSSLPSVHLPSPSPSITATGHPRSLHTRSYLSCSQAKRAAGSSLRDFGTSGVVLAPLSWCRHHTPSDDPQREQLVALSGISVHDSTGPWSIILPIAFSGILVHDSTATCSLGSFYRHLLPWLSFPLAPSLSPLIPHPSPLSLSFDRTRSLSSGGEV